MRRTLCLVLIMAWLCACDRTSPGPAAAPSAPASTDPDPAFVGRVWLSTTRGHPLGSMMIFLPDRTLVMGSCFEPYRIVQWGVAGEHIRWLEDTVPIEAAIEMPRPHQLVIRIAGRTQSYMAAGVPYKCPDPPAR